MSVVTWRHAAGGDSAETANRSCHRPVSASQCGTHPAQHGDGKLEIRPIHLRLSGEERNTRLPKTIQQQRPLVCTFPTGESTALQRALRTPGQKPDLGRITVCGQQASAEVHSNHYVISMFGLALGVAGCLFSLWRSRQNSNNRGLKTGLQLD